MAAVAANDAQLWKKILITKRVHLAVRYVAKNINTVLLHIIKTQVEGKCLSHGYIKRKSVQLESFSIGLLKAAEVAFDVVFSCEVCLPLNGQTLTCVVKSRTSAGIRAEVVIPQHQPSPIVVFLARDHHVNNLSFNRLITNEGGGGAGEEADEKEIQVTVIGQRFQLNDNQIRVIAELRDDESAAASIANDEYVPRSGRKRSVAQSAT